MYQVNSAIGKPIDPGSAWTEMSVVGKSVSELVATFTEIYLNVSNPFWEKARTVKLSELRPLITNTADTLNTFFASLGNESIPSIEGTASVVNGSVTSSDAFYAGYKLSRGLYAYTPEYIPDISDADVLVMKKEGVDARDIHKYCLVSVNGLIHRVDADSSYAYILGAAKAWRHTNRNEVSVTSFASVGALECISITEDMLSRAHPDQPMANQVIIKSPVNPGNRVAALVFGGYLFLMDNLSFSRCAEDTFVLDVQNISIVDRFFETRRLIDVEFLGLEYGGAHQAQISREQLTSDETLKKWLTHSQSFLVFIDTDNLTVSREQIRDTMSDRLYVHDTEPVVPIVLGSGLMPPYWKEYNEGKWAISIGDNKQFDYLMHTTPAEDVPMPADNERPYAPQDYRRAFLMNITTQKVVIS